MSQNQILKNVRVKRINYKDFCDNSIKQNIRISEQKTQKIQKKLGKYPKSQLQEINITLKFSHPRRRYQRKEKSKYIDIDKSLKVSNDIIKQVLCNNDSSSIHLYYN